MAPRDVTGWRGCLVDCKVGRRRHHRARHWVERLRAASPPAHKLEGSGRLRRLIKGVRHVDVAVTPRHRSLWRKWHKVHKVVWVVRCGVVCVFGG